MGYPKNTILVVGQAKPSRGDAICQTHGEFYISLVLERDTGLILDAACNTILDVTAAFVRELLVGRRLGEDLAAMEADIRTRYFALTQKPLIACLKDAANRYRAAQSGESV
ncbi:MULTISPECIES: DUF3870 domain-containing protein [unclassified Oscillibacter]|uniref:DUF3870 domain-containing protein n=1 Tax=unclassified Oscillibacter TaxID=2629304 RepID=UPI0025D69F07|nr:MULTISPECIES: DUF3870 domain-containing protein [unclassified Oscillibacter]